MQHPRIIRHWRTAAAALGLVIAAGPAPVQAQPDDGYQNPPRAPRAAPAARVGEVVAIDPIRTRPHGSGAGAVAGGIVGGLIGNQVFGGTAATAVGAVGGAVAGNNLERNHREGVDGYRVTVRFPNGSSRTLTQSQVGNLHVGDRVRIQGDRIQRG